MSTDKENFDKTDLSKTDSGKQVSVECEKTKCCKIWNFFKNIFCRKKKIVHEDKEVREHLTEKKIDKMVKDSFPASDPPSTY